MPTLAANPKGNDLRPGDKTTGPIVVASDGSEASTPALVLAAEMAGGDWSQVKVIAVHEAQPLLHFEIGMLPASTADVDAVRASLRRSVEKQLTGHAAGADRPDVIVRDGRIADELARAARELRARVLLLGVRHRSLIDRLLGREISLQVLRRSHIPVCVVPDGWSRLPSSMVVATDFSAASLFAAQTALELFDSVQHVYLVHVSPHHERQPAEYAAWLSGPGEDLQREFDRFKAALDVPPHVMIDPVTLEGRPGHEIIKFAASAYADLVVTGSRGALRFADQMFVGSTAQGLVRAAPCAVLAVRPSAQLTTSFPPSQERETMSSERWSSEVDAFSKRNTGRSTRIDIDDADCGAHTQVEGYPLNRVSYDGNRRQLSMMVGACDAETHLTRTVSDVEMIEFLPDQLGHDSLLRITHVGGQTLLTLLPQSHPPIVTGRLSELM